MSHHICTRPIPTDLNLRVLLCLQEDLRERLRKMEAGASDKDKVEAPKESTIARLQPFVCWICMKVSRCISLLQDVLRSEIH